MTPATKLRAELQVSPDKALKSIRAAFAKTRGLPRMHAIEIAARELGVSQRTLFRWEREFPSVAEIMPS